MKYIRVPLRNLIRIRKIVTCFTRSATPLHRSGSERHNFWELVYIRRGRAVAQAGGHPKQLMGGEAILHAPNIPHALEGDGKDTFDFFIVSFECHSPVLQGICGRVLGVPMKLRTLTDLILQERRMSFAEGFMPLEARHGAPIGGEQMIQLYLEQLLIGVLRSEAEKNGAGFFTTNGEMEKQVAEDIRSYLETRIEGETDMQELCRRFHYGKSRLSEIFRKVYGESVMHYYRRRKIERAQEYLDCPEERSVSEIAGELHFDSPQYFARIFRKYAGMSPRDYRSAHRRGG